MENIFDKTNDGHTSDGNLSNDESAMQLQLADDLNTSRSDLSDNDLDDNHMPDDDDEEDYDDDSRDAALAIEENLKEFDSQQNQDDFKSSSPINESPTLDQSQDDINLPFHIKDEFTNPYNDELDIKDHIPTDFSMDDEAAIANDLEEKKEKKKESKSKKELEEEDREKMQ